MADNMRRRMTFGSIIAGALVVAKTSRAFATEPGGVVRVSDWTGLDVTGEVDPAEWTTGAGT